MYSNCVPRAWLYCPRLAKKGQSVWWFALQYFSAKAACRMKWQAHPTPASLLFPSPLLGLPLLVTFFCPHPPCYLHHQRSLFRLSYGSPLSSQPLTHTSALIYSAEVTCAIPRCTCIAGAFVPGCPVLLLMMRVFYLFTRGFPKRLLSRLFPIQSCSITVYYLSLDYKLLILTDFLFSRTPDMYAPCCWISCYHVP